MELEKNYTKYLPRNYVEDVKEINDIKSNDLINYELPFNLNVNYKVEFDKFKTKFGHIIADIHVKLAASSNV